ncbi:MAG TPA: histidine phosphatase family protein [Actinomycetota bacterium]|nr:histidine phosphatase family protein [Actinomycetota bacterium]
MRRLTLIRHGHAAAGWADDPDPGLDALGHAQAAALVDLVDGPAPLFVSPLRRTRETAAPLAQAWSIEPVIEPGVGEITAPDGLDDRAAWLRAALASSYADLGAVHGSWRDRVLSTLRSLPDGAVVVSHFVAINAAVGAASGDDRLVCFTPDNCSRTTLTVDADGRFSVVELGAGAVTTVN